MIRDENLKVEINGEKIEGGLYDDFLPLVKRDLHNEMARCQAWVAELTGHVVKREWMNGWPQRWKLRILLQRTPSEGEERRGGGEGNHGSSSSNDNLPDRFMTRLEELGGDLKKEIVRGVERITQGPIGTGPSPITGQRGRGFGSGLPFRLRSRLL